MFINKKAQFFGGGMGGSRPSLFLTVSLGLLGLAIGASAIVSSIGMSVPIPSLIYSPIVVKVLIVLAGLLLLIRSFTIMRTASMLNPGSTGITSLIAGILLAIIGTLPLLNDLNLLTFLPFVAKLTIPPVVLGAVLAGYGLWLLVVSFKLFRLRSMGYA